MFERFKQFNQAPADPELPIEVKDRINQINQNIDISSLLDMQIDLELADKNNPHKETLVQAIKKRIADLKESAGTNKEEFINLERLALSKDERAEIQDTHLSNDNRDRYLSVEKVLQNTEQNADKKARENLEKIREEAKLEILKITLLKEFQLSQELISVLIQKYIPKITGPKQNQALETVRNVDAKVGALYMRFQEANKNEDSANNNHNYIKAIFNEMQTINEFLPRLFTAVAELTK